MYCVCMYGRDVVVSIRARCARVMQMGTLQVLLCIVLFLGIPRVPCCNSVNIGQSKESDDDLSFPSNVSELDMWLFIVVGTIVF